MENLSLSGGAFKASAFIGCITYLEDHDMMKDIQNVIGSSAGAIIGMLICLGFNAAEMREFVVSELQGFIDQEVELENLFNIFYSLGVDDGSNHVRVFEKALSLKNIPINVTFGQLQDHSIRNLIICGSNLTTSEIEYFCAKNTPDMEVTMAVRISISIPFIVQPVFYNNMVYVDASLFNNNPSNYFEKNTLCLLISSPPSSAIASLEDLNLLSYTHLMMTSVFKRMNQKDLTTDLVVDIVIDDEDFDVETFKLRACVTDIDKYIAIGHASITHMMATMSTKKQTLEV